jgi:CSLREA domain-containing protein
MRRPLHLLVWLVLLLAAPASANDYTVDSTADAADPNPGDGICDDGAGNCTLRAAIQTANAHGGDDTVIVPAGVYELTLKRDADLPDEQTGDLDVTGDTTITGAGEDTPCNGAGCTAIDGGGGKDRVFDVALGGSLLLESLSMGGGKAAKTDLNPNQVDDEVSGGCIRVAGSLATDGVVIDGCSSPDDGGCIGVVDGAQASLAETFLTACKAKDGGGGIEADEASLDLIQVTISDSKAGDEGGGLEVSDSEANLRNVTLSGNKAKRGGGLIAEDTAAVFVNNSTFAGNSASDGASILGASSEPVLIQNTILASKKGNDCSGFGDSLGNNVDAGTSCSLSGPNDQSDVDPRLGPLEPSNGVPTHPPLEGSPAIDRGNDSTCEATDARGAPRVDVGGVGTLGVECDVGAHEFGAPS